ncbi:serine/threonine-protein kinase BLUS1-like [Solanum dulcamara]|uniref:serine/threonine-protein kinase BLUS1-like n=1 Tax=Solanum dulcamara TaxID=45834 RepID=UPI0024860ABE|nr:serine/threonine-protein kinase BLUS1-like [Solanum dulcamara]
METQRKKMETDGVKKVRGILVIKPRFIYRPLYGTIIIDPITHTKYILQKVIGACENHFIYKARYYTVDGPANKSLLPSGYATVKFIRPTQEVCQSQEVEASIPNSNIIHVSNWHIRNFKEGFLVAMPYMSEGSLRYILATRFKNGLPEDCIAIALKQALLGLSDLHNSGRVHQRFSVGNIYVNFIPRPISNVEIRLGFAVTIYKSDLEPYIFFGEGKLPDGQPEQKYLPRHDLQSNSDLSAPPEVFYKKYDDNLNPVKSPLFKDYDEVHTVKSDIWLVGIAALELAYGNLRISNRKEFEALIKKIKRSKRLPDKLEDLIEEIHVVKGKGKMKKAVGYFNDKLKVVKGKRSKKFSEEFEELVLDCLSSKESKRPTVKDLLERPFFQNAKALKWFQRRVLYAKDPIIADV